jgi:hypothetical protein
MHCAVLTIHCAVLTIHLIVNRINAKFPDSVDYKEIPGNVPLDERMAVWLSAEFLLNTAVREGLNLWPLEYVFMRQPPLKPGIVLTSEFTTCCHALNGAIRFNPFHLERVVVVLDKALTMSGDERAGRHARDLPYVSQMTPKRWTLQVQYTIHYAPYTILIKRWTLQVQYTIHYAPYTILTKRWTLQVQYTIHYAPYTILIKRWTLQVLHDMKVATDEKDEVLTDLESTEGEE